MSYLEASYMIYSDEIDSFNPEILKYESFGHSVVDWKTLGRTIHTTFDTCPVSNTENRNKEPVVIIYKLKTSILSLVVLPNSLSKNKKEISDAENRELWKIWT